ncbi:terminase large subunit domain-containing protein [Tessaracoccus massiliensis]|uniref:terminase large subunit domain-containing protein n=1 Tax=Tessaracoccus massiliensis TaxID=1522311 RepID=UPI000693F9A6|nr:terminase family protein [Tessaracoccus massiliensis]
MTTLSTSRTKPGARKLSEVAKRLSVPTGIASTGWPQTATTCRRKLGITFDDWQHGLGRVILSKRDNGRLATTIDGVGISAPRQVGKTYTFSGLLFALCVDMAGLLVIWSAQHSRTHEETFRDMQAFAQRAKVKPFVRHVHTGSGTEEIAFLNGSRILFGAREAGFGRGIPGVDVLVFDEAQILSEKAMSNMLATMNTSKFGLHVYIGTPPKPEDAGKSEVFTRMREQAAAGELPDGAWIEIGAEKGDDPDDRQVWARMNPSYPLRTPEESILRLRRKLTPGDFRREGMGIWDDEADKSPSLISAGEWAETATTEPPEGIRSLAIVFDFDGSRQAVAGAVKHDEGVHVELIGAHSGSAATGTRALVTWLTADPVRPERWRSLAAISIAGGGEASTLHRALVDAGVPRQMIHLMNTPQVLAANAMLLDAQRDRTLTHPIGEETDALTASATQCDQKVRTGGWSWKPMTAEADQLPIEAAAMAVWTAKTTKRHPVGDRRESTRGRGSGRGRAAGRR